MSYELKQLGQSAPGDTDAVSIYSPAAGVTAKILSVFVCNTTAGAVSFRLFHDDDGTSYAGGTSLFYDQSVAANTTTEITTEIYMNNSAGNLAVRCSSANTLVFTVYGEEHSALSLGD